MVSNPPYIAANDAHLSHGDLPAEPALALIGGHTGLESIEHIVGRAPDFLRPGGWLLLEHGFDQAEAVAAFIANEGVQQSEYSPGLVWAGAYDGGSMAELTDAELARYARQLILPEVDLEGQSRLKRGRVLIIGAGGLGTPIAQYLAGAGVGVIRIADNDHIELSNLPRQLAYTEQDVGQFKADVLARRLVEGNPGVAVDARVTRFDIGSAPDLLEEIDLVLDATDSFQDAAGY